MMNLPTPLIKKSALKNKSANKKVDTKQEKKSRFQVYLKRLMQADIIFSCFFFFSQLETLKKIYKKITKFLTRSNFVFRQDIF